MEEPTLPKSVPKFDLPRKGRTEKVTVTEFDLPRKGRIIKNPPSSPPRSEQL